MIMEFVNDYVIPIAGIALLVAGVLLIHSKLGGCGEKK